ncbi:hypothetical protein CCP3SC1AL1_2270002 [Gammaproteobacteria bacterium]
MRALISKRVKETHWDCSGSKNPLYGMRRFGKDNPAYIHGESCRKYPFTFSKELKSNVFKRDEYVCQRCKKYPCNDLTVHHIDYNKENNLKNNLITLCRRCNCQVNANREYWTKYFQFLMEVI